MADVLQAVCDRENIKGQEFARITADDVYDMYEQHVAPRLDDLEADLLESLVTAQARREQRGLSDVLPPRERDLAVR